MTYYCTIENMVNGNVYTKPIVADTFEDAVKLAKQLVHVSEKLVMVDGSMV